MEDNINNNFTEHNMNNNIIEISSHVSPLNSQKNILTPSTCSTLFSSKILSQHLFNSHKFSSQISMERKKYQARQALDLMMVTPLQDQH